MAAHHSNVVEPAQAAGIASSSVAALVLHVCARASAADTAEVPLPSGLIRPYARVPNADPLLLESVCEYLGSVFVDDDVQLDFNGPRLSLFVWPEVTAFGESTAFGEDPAVVGALQSRCDGAGDEREQQSSIARVSFEAGLQACDPSRAAAPSDMIATVVPRNAVDSLPGHGRRDLAGSADPGPAGLATGAGRSSRGGRRPRRPVRRAASRGTAAAWRSGDRGSR